MFTVTVFMASSDSSLNFELQRLRAIRHSFLRLHKALLDAERETYEMQHGAIAHSGEFFQLVISHQWFDWLRPMSQFIVQIDELFDQKDAIAPTQVTELLQQAQTLLRASEYGSESQQRYYQAIQRNPDLAFIHAETANLLKVEQK